MNKKLQNIRKLLSEEGSLAINSCFKNIFSVENERISHLTCNKINDFSHLEKEYLNQKVPKGIFPIRFIQNIKNKIKFKYNFFSFGTVFFKIIISLIVSFLLTIISLNIFNIFTGHYLFLFLLSYLFFHEIFKKKNTNLTTVYLEKKEEFYSINKYKEKSLSTFNKLLSSEKNLEKNILFTTRSGGWESCILKNKTISKDLLLLISELLSEEELSQFLNENDNNISIEAALIKYVELNKNFKSKHIAKSLKNDNIDTYKEERILA